MSKPRAVPFTRYQLLAQPITAAIVAYVVRVVLDSAPIAVVIGVALYVLLSLLMPCVFRVDETGMTFRLGPVGVMKAEIARENLRMYRGRSATCFGRRDQGRVGAFRFVASLRNNALPLVDRFEASILSAYPRMRNEIDE